VVNARTPRSAWVDEGLRTLAVGGPDAVRIEALARNLGVSKGGFYWYFDDRQALLDELLDAWERMFIDEVIAHVERQPGDGKEKLRRLFALAASVGEPLKIDPAVRAWARHDKAVARRLRRVDNRRMEYLRALFSEFCPDEDDVEARCVTVMALFIGGHLMAADHGTRTRAEAIALALAKLES
jgi:AcrR family transcriptional regulator